MNKRILFGILLFSSLTLARVSALSAAEKRAKFISCGEKYLGVPYVHGGTTASGFDCSGFVYRASKDAGLSLPRASDSMYSKCTKIDKSQLQRGDLVFFTEGKGISHVSIYYGNNQLLHCISDGPKTGVVISSMSESYWKNHYYASGRFLGEASSIEIENVKPKEPEPKKTTPKTTEPKPETPKPATPKTTSPKTSSSSSSNKDVLNYIDMDIKGFIDWNFIKSDYNDFYIKSCSLQGEIKADAFQINPGIMLRLIYHQEDANYSLINIPVCFVLGLSDNFEIYGGIKCTQTIDFNDPYTIPGFFGLTLQTSPIDLLGFNLRLIQDVNYTLNKADIESGMTFRGFAQNVSFSTGFGITIK